MANLGSFAKDISKFCERTKVKPTLVLRKIAFDIFRGVIKMSPVDTGRFRASWRVSINRVDLSTDNTQYHKKLRNKETKMFTGKTKTVTKTTVVQATGSGSKVISNAKYGDQIYITNNVPYAVPLEHGHSKQAPGGMVRVTIARVVGGFKKTVEEVVQQTGG